MQNKYKGMTRRVLRQYAEASSSGAIRSYSINLTAERSGTVYSPYGIKHNTYIMVDAAVDREQLKAWLSDNPILVGEQQIKYIADAQFLKERHFRKAILVA